jgi:UDP-2,3-diacylglucosamine pyrophosphatase LpxH
VSKEQLIPISSSEQRKGFFQSEQYKVANGILHFSDAHLGMYFLDEDKSDFDERIQRLESKIKKAKKEGKPNEKIEILEGRKAFWQQQREAKLCFYGGIESFNARVTQLVNKAIEGNLLINLNGDIFELIEENTKGEFATQESEHFRNEMRRYYPETGRKVFYTPGNHDERNLHRNSTSDIKDFLESDTVLVMPKMWFDPRSGAVVTHGDLPNYREGVLEKTRALLQQPDFVQLSVNEQIQTILDEVDTDDPSGPKGAADGGIGIIVEKLADMLGKKKAKELLENIYLGHVFPKRRDRKQERIPKRIKEVLSQEFFWMDEVARMNNDIIAFITGHTHHQLLQTVATPSGKEFVEANSGAMIGSVVHPPSALQVDYNNRMFCILEWGKRKLVKGKNHKSEGKRWRSTKEHPFCQPA